MLPNEDPTGGKNNNNNNEDRKKISFANEPVVLGESSQVNKREDEEFDDLRSHLRTAKSFLDKYDALGVLGNFTRVNSRDRPENNSQDPAESPRREKPDPKRTEEDANDLPRIPSSPPSHATLTRMVMKLETPPTTYRGDVVATLSRRQARSRTLKRIQAEIMESTDDDVMRLQQQLQLSNATARELDEVILMKNQQSINNEANIALENTKEGGSIRRKGPVRREISGDDVPITMEDRLGLAAIYIRDAIEGRATVSRTVIGGKIWNFISTRYYKIFLVLVILYHMAIVFGEPPSYQEVHSVPRSKVRGLYGSELVCIFIYAVDIILRHTVNGWRYFIQSPSRLIFILTVLVIFVDTLVAFGVDNSARPTRCLRPLLLLTKSRTLREITATIIRTLRKLVDLVLLIIILMVAYAVAGVQLYNNKYPKEDNPKNFDDVSNSLLTLYVLLTTENYPSIMEPAYAVSPWSVIFFLSFLLIVAYLLMSVLVAVVLDTYKSLRKEKLIKDRVTERRGLATAFRLLDVGDSGHIDFSLWEQLFAIVSPRYDPTQVRLLFQTIDEDRNGKVNIIEFFALCDVLLLRFRKDEEEVSLMPKIVVDFFNKYLPRRAANRVAQQRIFHMLVILIILGNIIVLVLMGRVDVDDNVLFRVNLAFLCLLVVEITIKIIAWGSLFWKHLWNRFDFAIMFIVTVAQIAALSAKGGSSLTLEEDSYVRVLNAISSLRVLRIISSFRRTRLIAFTVSKLAPLMLSVVALLVCVFYFYAIIGMEIFADNVNVDLVTKFRNFPYAMLALFQQLTESDWHTVMYAAMDATTFSVSWYFVTFNVIVAIIILNLLIALIIDTFVLQHEILRSQGDILLEIPDADNKSTKKSKWHVWKDLGSKWERELITNRDIPELQEEDFKQASDVATNELEKLKRRTPEQVRRPLSTTISTPEQPRHSQGKSNGDATVDVTITE